MDAEKKISDTAAGQLWHGQWAVRNLALVVALGFALGWGTTLVIAVYRGRESLIISGMFESVGMMIFSTLAVLVGGKAWRDFMPIKFGGTGGAPPPPEPEAK